MSLAVRSEQAQGQSSVLPETRGQQRKWTSMTMKAVHQLHSGHKLVGYIYIVGAAVADIFRFPYYLVCLGANKVRNGEFWKKRSVAPVNIHPETKVENLDEKNHLINTAKKLMQSFFDSSGVNRVCYVKAIEKLVTLIKDFFIKANSNVSLALINELVFIAHTIGKCKDRYVSYTSEYRFTDAFLYHIMNGRNDIWTKGYLDSMKDCNAIDVVCDNIVQEAVFLVKSLEYGDYSTYRNHAENQLSILLKLQLITSDKKNEMLSLFNSNVFSGFIDKANDLLANASVDKLSAVYNDLVSKLDNLKNSGVIDNGLINGTMKELLDRFNSIQRTHEINTAIKNTRDVEEVHGRNEILFKADDDREKIDEEITGILSILKEMNVTERELADLKEKRAKVESKVAELKERLSSIRPNCRKNAE
ncbi:MAG: hypothetical protein HW387_445 [Parachlamydiales bacterium]|nr:hypothetical protein [Parachlamydiales bacterium]